MTDVRTMAAESLREAGASPEEVYALTDELVRQAEAKARASAPAIAVGADAPVRAKLAAKSFTESEANRAASAARQRALVEHSEPAGAITQMAAATPTFPEERMAYLQRFAGPGGEIEILDDGTAIVRKADGKMVNIGRGWASKVPGAAEMVAGAAGGLAGPLGGAVAAAGANAMRQSAGRDIAAGDVRAGVGRLVGGLAGAALPSPGMALVGQEIGGAVARRRPVPPGAEVSALDRIAQPVIAAGLSFAGDVAGAGARAGGRAVARAISPDVRAAETLARGGSRSAFGGTLADATERAKALSERTGIPLDPAQASGGSEIATMMRARAQTPGFIDKAAEDKARQVEFFGKFLKKTIGHVAANPESLSDAGVASRLIQSATKYFEDRHEALSLAEAPLYEAAGAAFGGKRLVNVDQALGRMAEIVEDARIEPGAAGKIPGVLRRAAGLASESGKVTIRDYQKLRQYAGKVSAGKLSLGGSLEPSESRRIGGMLLGALQDDLEATTKSIAGGPGARELNEAIRIGREGRQAIDKETTEAVSSILRADINNPELVAKRLVGMEGTELRSVLQVADKADPALGKDLRGHLLRGIFESGGFERGADLPFRPEVPIGNISPSKIRGAMAKRDSALRAAFDGDVKAVQNLQDVADIAHRLGYGPAGHGSPTYANFAQAAVQGVLRKLAGGQGATSAVGGAAADKLLGWFDNPDAFFAVVSERRGLENLARISRLAFDPRPLSAASGKATSAALRGLALTAGMTILRPHITPEAAREAAGAAYGID